MIRSRVEDRSTAAESLRRIDRAGFEEARAVAGGAVIGQGELGREEGRWWASQFGLSRRTK